MNGALNLKNTVTKLAIFNANELCVRTRLPKEHIWMFEIVSETNKEPMAVNVAALDDFIVHRPYFFWKFNCSDCLQNIFPFHTDGTQEARRVPRIYQRIKTDE